MRARFALSLVAALGFYLTTTYAAAQAPAGDLLPSQLRHRPTSGRSSPALDFYGASRSMAYVPPSRPTPLPAPLPVQTRPIAKPFSGVQQASALSPYLALDARESETSLPNYYLYVKPQLDQQRYNQVQQAQYRRLSQDVRKANAGGAVTSPSGGIPTTGHSAQFMNIGDYYPGLQRK